MSAGGLADFPLQIVRHGFQQLGFGALHRLAE